MAQEQEDLTLDNAKSGKKKKIIIIAVVVALLVAVGIGAWFFFFNSSSDKEMMTKPGGDDPKLLNMLANQPRYVSLYKPFVFNVKGKRRDRLVQIKVQLMVPTMDEISKAQEHLPLIRSTLLTVFSTASAELLQTSDGKQSIRQQALREVRNVLKQVTGESIVDRVLFTEFVMQ